MMSRIANIVSGTGTGLDFLAVIVFAVGAVTGIIAFSKFLHWLLQRYHRETLLVMAGFIIGSLVKVWPWSDKATLVMSQYPELMALDETGGLTDTIVEQYFAMIDPHVGGAVAFALAGFLLVVGIEVASSVISRRRGADSRG